MPENENENETAPPEGGEGEIRDPNIKRIRDENEQLRKDLAELRRGQAFEKAGLPDTPMAQFFAENYKGDLTPEAIKAEAARVGLTLAAAAAGATPPPPASTAAEQTGAQVSDLLAGETLPPGEQSTPDPQRAGLDTFNERMKNGEERERASVGFFDQVFEAASKGDQRVLTERRGGE